MFSGCWSLLGEIGCKEGAASGYCFGCSHIAVVTCSLHERCQLICRHPQAKQGVVVRQNVYFQSKSCALPLKPTCIKNSATFTSSLTVAFTGLQCTLQSFTIAW